MNIDQTKYTVQNILTFITALGAEIIIATAACLFFFA